MKTKKTHLAPKQKKILLAAVLAAVVIIGVGAFFLIRLVTRPEEKTEKPIVYFPADYEKNILEDPVYLDFDRDLYFTKDGITRAYDAESVSGAAPECRFIMSVLQCIIHGDHEAYPSYFLRPEEEKDRKFTMQELYDIQVDFGGVAEEETEDGVLAVQNYRVRYRIHRNNGTYRSGIRSDAQTTQIYQLCQTESGEFRLYRILDVIYHAS